jgi:hypothetical protein
MSPHRFVCLFALAAAGCGSRPSADRFTPADALARAAIHEALSAWKEGRPAGRAGAGGPAIKVADVAQKSTSRPSGFNIIGEVAGPKPRTYAVRLQFSDPPSERPVKYLVVGIDPLWVFQERDYELISHWEHPMHEAEVVPADAK